MNSMTVITATNPVADVARLTVEKNALPAAGVSFPAKDIAYPLFNIKSALTNSNVLSATQEVDTVVNINPVSIINESNIDNDIARLTTEMQDFNIDHIVNPDKDIEYPIFNENESLLSSSSQSEAEYDAIHGLENITIINNVMKAIYGQDSYYNYCIYQ